jgi:hypothetical protein
VKKESLESRLPTQKGRFELGRLTLEFAVNGQTDVPSTLFKLEGDAFGA